jgi:hypothetical protein
VWGDEVSRPAHAGNGQPPRLINTQKVAILDIHDNAVTELGSRNNVRSTKKGFLSEADPFLVHDPLPMNCRTRVAEKQWIGCFGQMVTLGYFKVGCIQYNGNYHSDGDH